MKTFLFHVYHIFGCFTPSYFKSIFNKNDHEEKFTKSKLT